MKMFLSRKQQQYVIIICLTKILKVILVRIFSFIYFTILNQLIIIIIIINYSNNNYKIFLDI